MTQPSSATSMATSSARNDNAESYLSVPLTIRLECPISQLSWITKSLLFAELSRLSYGPPDMVSEIVFRAGIDRCEFIEYEGAEAYVLGNRFDCMIVCRGTEPTQWNDIAADANVWTVASEVGRVHRGFHEEVGVLWPMLEQQIEENQLPVWFAGHSLGGAMAAVCAVRCKLSPIPSNPQGIFTYGAPRVGNRTYSKFLTINHFRWVNNNDIVARIPPRWLGYHHMGREIYLNRRGKISLLRRWLRVHDRLRGMLSALRLWKVDYLSDHSMNEYVKHVASYYGSEISGTKIPLPPFLMDD